jgi:hypothetical protein
LAENNAVTAQRLLDQSVGDLPRGDLERQKEKKKSLIERTVRLEAWDLEARAQ